MVIGSFQLSPMSNIAEALSTPDCILFPGNTKRKNKRNGKKIMTGKKIMSYEL
jgi:hypothetical protein